MEISAIKGKGRQEMETIAKVCIIGLYDKEIKHNIQWK